MISFNSLFVMIDLFLTCSHCFILFIFVQMIIFTPSIQIYPITQIYNKHISSQFPFLINKLCQINSLFLCFLCFEILFFQISFWFENCRNENLQKKIKGKTKETANPFSYLCKNMGKSIGEKLPNFLGLLALTPFLLAHPLSWWSVFLFSKP